MAQKLAIHFLSSLIISGTCMVIQRAPIPFIFQYNDDPNYTFSYDVNDPRTGDVKNQQESRRGDRVTGQYSLVQPDGIKRTVEYRADDLQGFLATVNNERIEAKLPKNQERVSNNRQRQEDDPCNDCLAAIDPRLGSDITTQPSRSIVINNVPIQWQVDYTNVHNEPRTLPEQEESNTPQDRNDDDGPTQKSIAKIYNDRNDDVKKFPVATSRTSIIQRIDNNHHVIVENIPWI